MNDAPEAEYLADLDSITGLKELVQRAVQDLDVEDTPIWMELVLHGLSEQNKLGRSVLNTGHQFLRPVQFDVLQ